MNELTYACTLCHMVFSAVRQRENSVARCPSCGSMKCQIKRVDAISPTHTMRQEGKALILEPRVAENLQGKFHCTDCLHTYEMELRPKDTPFCPKCNGTDVTALTPLATFISDKGRKIEDKAEIKRLKFIRNAWSNQVKFKSTSSGLAELACRLGVPDNLVRSMEAALGLTLTYLEQKHDDMLTEYENYKRGTQ